MGRRTQGGQENPGWVGESGAGWRKKRVGGEDSSNARPAAGAPQGVVRIRHGATGGRGRTRGKNPRNTGNHWVLGRMVPSDFFL